MSSGHIETAASAALASSLHHQRPHCCALIASAQGYGFVEFATPSAAAAAKGMMEKIENEMRPDHRGSRGGDKVRLSPRFMPRLQSVSLHTSEL